MKTIKTTGHINTPPNKGECSGKQNVQGNDCK